VPAAHAALAAGIAKAGPALGVEVIGTGHAHIDVAWLWTLGQTRRKAGRTFHTVMRLMEQFPNYHFTQSQPQVYDYVRQDYPALFEAIKARIAEGRWEPIGGMWVEADCNLSGSESLARQFLLGRSFFRQHFGAEVESPVLWLPDVFGYAWNLPQLIREAGLEYFFTIKIGWSQYNRLPYDSFWWQGLDGTKVLTHFSTTPDFGAYASTYNAMATPAQNLGTWTNFCRKSMQQTLLMAFGYGDGGGGPTREMLENIEAMRHFPGLPRCATARSRSSTRRWRLNPAPPAHLERRTVPGAAPRHLHHAEPQQARQPQERVPAPRRRIPGDAGQPDRWLRLPAGGR
jgi:alpha-mannosidase